MPPSTNYNWDELERKATGIVEACLASMPVEIQEIALRVPVLIRQWAPDNKEGNDDAADLLGEYIAYESQTIGDGDGAIILYLGAIKLYCEEEDTNYEEEIRRTYLHELGHHFGWDEDDLAARNLD